MKLAQGSCCSEYMSRGGDPKTGEGMKLRMEDFIGAMGDVSRMKR